MTQVGEGRGAVHGADAPVGGEVLAGRYQLEQHVNTDSAGRQIWRGIDVILRRQVAIVIRYPGGPAAQQMLQSAVEASRIVHPNLAGVYDAIDEEVRAYVVREWVDGASLRDHIAIGLFDTERAIPVAHAVSAAVTAVHSTGMTHGNIHPGTVLIGLDGRVVLADARADGAAPAEEDVRAVGGLLYFALTGYWPHAEVAGPAPLPDAMRDPNGALASPRQVRAGVPDFLDSLTMDLLDRRLAVPAGEQLAAEFARLDAEPSELAANAFYGSEEEPASEPLGGTAGPLRLSADPRSGATKPAGRKIAVGLAGLLVIGVVGLLVGLNWLTGSPSSEPDGPIGGPVPTAPGTDDATPEIQTIALSAGQVRVVDPEGNRGELENIENVVDDDLSTGWRTHTYYDGLTVVKPGLGILIDLGEPRQVATVRVEVDAAGATAELRAGHSDPGNDQAGDREIHATFEGIADPLVNHGGTTMVFNVPDDAEAYQYLMIWFTDLPPVPEGYQIEVHQVSVQGY